MINSICCKQKVFHMDEPIGQGWSKTNGVYEDKKFAWGHFITNKAFRTKEKFVQYVSIDGSYYKSFSKKDFDHFIKNNTEHIYIPNSQANQKIKQLKKLINEIDDLKLTGLNIIQHYHYLSDTEIIIITYPSLK